MNPNQQNEPFTTDAYMAGQYEQGLNPQGQIADLDPSKGGYDPTTGKLKERDRATRNVRMSDGIILPRYRLPTEAEWEFAAYGLIGNTIDERVIEKRIYPWDGHWVRKNLKKIFKEICLLILLEEEETIWVFLDT